MAHASPYLSFPLCNCTYNSHIKKYEHFLAYFMRILNSCVIYEFQTVNPGCPPWAYVEIFPGGGKVDILLILFRLLTMQHKWTYTKRFTLFTPQKRPNVTGNSLPY